MNSRQRKTLATIFARPTASSIRWNDVVSLIGALGDVDEKRSGSRVAFTVGERTMVTHKPHPGSELKKGAIESIREFLEEAGVEP